MRSSHNLIYIIIVILIFALSYNQSYNPLSIKEVVDSTSTFQEISKNSNSLKEEIKRKSAKFYEQPKNAVIDRVWKKTPGRNGLRIDQEASYEKMKEDGKFTETELIYEQVSPEIKLSDLPPAPIYRGHPEKKMVSLLINVSWGTKYIPNILHVLKEENVKATFFIEGKWAKENAELVKMIDEQGHVIGNHAYNHPDMARSSKDEINEQITETNQILKAITEETPKWFAPPSGSFNDNVVMIADELEMETILWSVDTIDWQNPTTTVMLNQVMDKIHPGAMILMHPTSVVSKSLSTMIKQIKEEEYKIGTVERLLKEER